MAVNTQFIASLRDAFPQEELDRLYDKASLTAIVNVIWLELLKRVEVETTDSDGKKVPVTVATFKRTQP